MKRLMGWRQALAATCVAIPFTLGGCFSGDPAVVGHQDGLEYLTGYSSEAWDRLMSEQETRTAECMRSHGFRYWIASDSYMTRSPHGLFGVRTPSAELSYLAQYGYGVAHGVAVMNEELEASRRDNNAVYFEALNAERKKAYVTAYYGTESNKRKGCAGSEEDLVHRLGLPDGGALGDEFGRAVDRAQRSGPYQRWERKVVDCIEKEGAQVPSGDLLQMGRPILKRLLDLAQSEYTTLDDGAIEYELTSDEAASVSSADLAELQRDEMHLAAIEIECRNEAGPGAQQAVDAATAPLANEFIEDVNLLRTAMQTGRDQ